MKVFLIALICAVVASPAVAEVKLPDVISSSMVLQQKQAIPIWGMADPGESVTVTFAGMKKTVVAGVDGKWRVDLGKFDASAEPRSITIAGKNAIILNNILVGEVWLVSPPSSAAPGGKWTVGGGFTAEANMPHGGDIVEFKSRLWIVRGKDATTEGTRLFFSKVLGQPDFWPVAP